MNQIGSSRGGPSRRTKWCVTTHYTKTQGASRRKGVRHDALYKISRSVTTDKIVRHDGRKSSTVILTEGYVLPLCVMTEGSVRHDGLYKNSMVRHDGGAVSYTHLTLPTIYSV